MRIMRYIPRAGDVHSFPHCSHLISCVCKPMLNTKLFCRYKATGEIRAIKTAMVHQSTFQYDGPTIDHPAFPGVSRELSEKKERKDENFAIEARKQAAINAANPSQPAGGYLLPGAKAAQELAVSNPEDASAAVSRRRHQKMKEEVSVS